MSEESAFLAAIREQPEDDSSRLVYADWLEDRGDPRAEYLRVEYQVRVQGAKDESKLQMLRSRLDPDWLQAVHDRRLGSDWTIVLQASPSDHRPALLELICEIAGLSEAEARRIVRSCPGVIKRGLRYWQAHQLRQRFANVGYVTVELRPLARD